MGGRQNYDPFLGTLNIRCRIVIGTQKRTIILTTTHVTPNPNHRGGKFNVLQTFLTEKGHCPEGPRTLRVGGWGAGGAWITYKGSGFRGSQRAEQCRIKCKSTGNRNGSWQYTRIFYLLLTGEACIHSNNLPL